MLHRKPRANCLRGPALPDLLQRAGAGAAVALLCLMAVPAYAHDDEQTSPPTAAAQAAAAQMTMIVFSLIAGVGVYYVMQRYRIINEDKHSPAWGKSMNRNAILAAVISAVAVGSVIGGMSRPAPKPTPQPTSVGAASSTLDSR